MDTICGAPNEAALLALMEKTGYHMIQENGQRKYGPPPDWAGPPPPRGCEIFVGKIPRDCYEDELVPAFERIGNIYEFRLMMDFSGSNRGYCFVMYTTRDDARRAITEMNNYEIRKGRYLGVCASVDNCRLFVGGIPKDKQQEEILDEMQMVTEGVVSVIVYPSVADKSKNRGFAFVEYDSHRAAAMARRKLIPGRIQLWGHQIAVDWAEPEKEVDDDVMSRVKILYIRNLMLNTSEETVHHIFNRAAGREDAVERVKKIKDYAFIHFHERHDAIRAMKNINGKQNSWLAAVLENNGNNIDGSPVQVVWAKPVDKNSYVRYTRNNVNLFPEEGFPYSELQYVSGSEAFLPPYQNNSDDLNNRLSNLNIHSGNGSLFTSPRNESPWNGDQNHNLRHQEHIFDNLPGIELLPASRELLGLKQSKAPVQILEELCQKNHWGRPNYHLHSTGGNHVTAGDGSGDIQLFAFTLTIPHLRNLFMANKWSTSIEKAQNVAAEHALQKLGIPLEGGDVGALINQRQHQQQQMLSSLSLSSFHHSTEMSKTMAPAYHHHHHHHHSLPKTNFQHSINASNLSRDIN